MSRHAAHRAPIVQRGPDHPVRRPAPPIDFRTLGVILGRTHSMREAPRYVAPWRRALARKVAEFWPVYLAVGVLLACAAALVWLWATIVSMA